MAHTRVTSTILGADPEADERLSELRSSGPEGRPATPPGSIDLGLARRERSIGERIGATISGIGEALEDLPAARRGLEQPSERRNREDLKREDDLLDFYLKQGFPEDVIREQIEAVDRAARVLNPDIGFTPEAKRYIPQFPKQALALQDPEFLASLTPEGRAEATHLARTDPKRLEAKEGEFRLRQLHTKTLDLTQKESGLSYREARRRVIESDERFAEFAPQLTGATAEELDDTAAAARMVREALSGDAPPDVDSLIADVKSIHPAADLKTIAPLLLARARDADKPPTNEIMLAFLAGGLESDPRTKQAVKTIRALPSIRKAITTSTMAWIAEGPPGPDRDRARRSLARVHGLTVKDIARFRASSRKTVERNSADSLETFASEEERARVLRERTSEALADILGSVAPEPEGEEESPGGEPVLGLEAPRQAQPAQAPKPSPQPPAGKRESLSRKSATYKRASKRGLTDEQIESQFNITLTE